MSVGGNGVKKMSSGLTLQSSFIIPYRGATHGSLKQPPLSSALETHTGCLYPEVTHTQFPPQKARPFTPSGASLVDPLPHDRGVGILVQIGLN